MFPILSFCEKYKRLREKKSKFVQFFCEVLELHFPQCLANWIENEYFTKKKFLKYSEV